MKGQVRGVLIGVVLSVLIYSISQEVKGNSPIQESKDGSLVITYQGKTYTLVPR